MDGVMTLAGTRRVFRLREVIPLDEVGKRTAQTFDIPLPHNSVCVYSLWPKRHPFDGAGPFAALYNACIYPGAIQALNTPTQDHRPLPPSIPSAPRPTRIRIRPRKL